jgi:hypothetical protein
MKRRSMPFLLAVSGVCGLLALIPSARESYAFRSAQGFSGTVHVGALSTVTSSLEVLLHSHALRADGSSRTQVHIQLEDGAGNNLALGGETIALSSDPQSLLFTDHAGSVPLTTVATDSGGSAVVDVVSSTHAGTVVITASDPGAGPTVHGSDRLTLAGSRFHTTILSATTLRADGVSTTTATVLVIDGNGDPVAGDTVSFAASGATLAQPSVVTDSNGQASDLATASTTPGAGTVTASDATTEDPADHFTTTMAFTLVPAPGPAASFIHRAYMTLLERDAEPAGVDYWVNLLDHGTSRPAVSRGLASMAEYRADVIGGTATRPGLYQRYLGRSPSGAELSYWLDRMAHGLTVEQARLAILASPEYFARYHNDPAATIEALYEDVLSRPADAAGRAYWLDHFATILPDFLLSYEGRAALVTQEYGTVLGRTPDAAGLDYWTRAIAGGGSDEDVIAGLLGSDEYYTLH